MRRIDVALEQENQVGRYEANCDSCSFELCGLRKLGARPRQRTLGRGERLGTQACLTLWTVLDGLVAQCTTLPDGRRQIVCLSLPGDVVCPISDAGDSSSWAEALTGSALCELELGHRAGSLGEDAALSAELFRMLHHKVKDVSAHLVTLGRLDGMERVCLFLAEMAWRSGRESSGGWRVHLPLSREDIADYLGLNAETVSRILSRVKKARLATFLSPTEYLVPDIEALRSRAPLSAPRVRRGGDAEERGLHLV